jgi:hypothetical protein
VLCVVCCVLCVVCCVLCVVCCVLCVVCCVLCVVCCVLCVVQDHKVICKHDYIGDSRGLVVSPSWLESSTVAVGL